MSTVEGVSVLVTGADGFIGSHLVRRLVADGANVRALCLYNSNGSFGWLDDLAPTELASVDVRLGDIRDAGFVDELVRGVEVVLHLAALISIPYSYSAPRSYVDTNVGGTLNILEAARARGVRQVIHTSTSEVYGTPDTVPITLQHPVRAQSPYAASKAGADQLCLAYAATFGLNVAVLRPFNTYGPRQSTRAIIPTILTQMLSNEPTITVGSLHPRRDFTFVTDTVDGFVRMVGRASPGQTIQLGTGAAVSIAELVEACRQVTGCTAPITTEERRVRPENSEVQVLISDPSSAAEIGWSPQVELHDGLKQTAAWLSERTSPTSRRFYL